MDQSRKSPMLPDDAHNQQLVANVHPSDWVNPVPSGRYNLVVIGAGTAGLITAVIAAGLGAKVALVEKHLMGGDCLNVGCVPSKGVLRAARAWADLKKTEEFGLHIPAGVTYDFGAVMARMRKLRAKISRNDMLGKVWMLNVWASWCAACRDEHETLVAFSKRGVVPVLGLNYKDERKDGLAWLNQFGNPYLQSLYDHEGLVGIDYGVYGDRKSVV